mmetsp:Transcript_15971/g.48782  ORF Transcript_15971/g.48782 Transcript_15971/m.48782 type:complete len:345 (-) Transcript_15971:592-1626(-)
MVVRGVAGALHARAEENAAGGAARVHHGVADDGREVAVEAGLVVALLDGGDDVEQVRVGAREALAVLDERARERVGALHGDGDGHGRVGVGHEVGRAVADAGTAEHVHGVVHADAHAVRHLLLHDGADDGGLLVLVDHAVHEVLRGRHDEGVRAEAREVLLHALELRDGHLELLADARVGAHRAHGALGRGHAHGGQRDGAALGEAVHEHVPAEAGALLAADDALHGDEHLLALHGAIHERRRERVVARTDAQAGVVALEQGHADALLADAAEQVIRVLALEREADHAGHRRERDVALLERRLDAELAVHHADLAAVRHGRGVGARARAREAEAGDELAGAQLG